MGTAQQEPPTSPCAAALSSSLCQQCHLLLPAPAFPAGGELGSACAVPRGGKRSLFSLNPSLYVLCGRGAAPQCT